MRIGEVAQQCGLRASAIRYYEQAGLLPKARRANGCRTYDPGVLHQITLIQFARDVGFTIQEVRILTGAFRPGHPLSVKLRKLAAKKIEEVERTIVRAQVMKGMLVDALQCDCMDAEECGSKIRAARRVEGNGCCGSSVRGRGERKAHRLVIPVSG